MTEHDEHPEHLLEQAAKGTLSAKDRSVLASHVNVCAACSAQLHAMRDFGGELSPGEFDGVLNERAVLRAMDSTRSLTASRPRRLAPWGIALGGVLLAGAGVAHWGSVLRSPPSSVPLRPPPSVVTPPHSASTSGAARGAPPSLEPSPPAAMKSAARPAPTAVLKKAPPPAPDATELFARATELRRAGQDGEALRVYLDLQRQFPASREALLSHAVAGQLLLERQQPAAATSQFDQYIQRGGALLEDALLGKAIALERLGRREEASATWEALLRQFPSSVHAGRAKRRVEELR